MSNLSTYRGPILKGNAATYGSAVSVPVLTLDAKGNAVLSTAPLSTKLSTFTNDAGFLVGTASVANSIDTLVKRNGSGGTTISALTLLGVPGATQGSGSEHASIEMGRMDIASTPLIDFHSSGTGNDYDVRLIATGGNSVAALGSLNFFGASMNFNSPVFAGASQTTAANINLYLSETGHSTSKRASMRIGTGWEMGQDPSVNGVRDFYLYNNSLSTSGMIINASTNNVNLSNGLTVATSVYSGVVCGTARTAAKGSAQFSNGDSTHTGYVEFFPAGTGARHGWMGYSDGTTLNISAEVGYWNFIGNGPRVSGSAIWHKGNLPNPVIDNRYAFAGDLTTATLYGNVGGAMYEPYAGAVVSGFAVNSASTITQVRFRYIQKQDSNGNWFTLAYN